MATARIPVSQFGICVCQRNLANTSARVYRRSCTPLALNSWEHSRIPIAILKDLEGSG